MSGLSTLRRLFTAKHSSITAAPSSITAATSTAIESESMYKRKRGRVTPSFHTLPIDYETPEGMRNVVDKFKRLCKNKYFRRSVGIYTDVVRKLAKAKAFPLIEEIIEAQKQYKEITTEGFIVRLINLYAKAGMPDHARKLFDEMPNLNCPGKNLAFSSLINAYVAAGQYDVAVGLFREISAKYSIQPDVVSFNVFIHALCKMDSLDSAVGVLDEMGELDLEPNLITFNTLLGQFYEKRGLDEGEKIWTMMKTRNVEPDAVSYRLRMGGMVGDGKLKDAVELFHVMKLSGVNPDVHCFNVLVKGFVGDDNVEEAKVWYDELVKSECEPVRSTYVTLAPFFTEKGEFDLAFQLCKDAMKGSRLAIDAEALKQVVEGFVAKGMIEEAIELVNLAGKKKLEV
ncbi:pentatricopeptide repeat-containing protein At1g55890, mitochondrial [Arachis duranensis]|uniref:Pentatricopeptide repeat-containing protein At1g55890, mitochondrial n=1 Tax=Arachis duranensis TaxID=130453 RepID=A0A6P4BJS0_ARADU|nr:pentatricopeptide repeat-containing protein At1g55890, mitochondrial [Arachis duranensis]